MAQTRPRPKLRPLRSGSGAAAPAGRAGGRASERAGPLGGGDEVTARPAPPGEGQASVSAAPLVPSPPGDSVLPSTVPEAPGRHLPAPPTPLAATWLLAKPRSWESIRPPGVRPGLGLSDLGQISWISAPASSVGPWLQGFFLLPETLSTKFFF